MKFQNNEPQSRWSMVGWLDSVQMSEHDRAIAKAYLRKTEAMCDFIWLAAARIRAVFARGPANRTPVGTELSGQVPSVDHRA